MIRARLAGARLAKGDVLVFLDAHCECVVEWLEPLVQRIQEKHTSVLVPIIDVIEAKNFYYSTNGYDTFQASDKKQKRNFSFFLVEIKSTLVKTPKLEIYIILTVQKCSFTFDERERRGECEKLIIIIIVM